jgi:hypothetical protein
MNFTLTNGWRLRRGKHLKEDVRLYAMLLAHTRSSKEEIMKPYTITVTIQVQADDEDHALDQALDQIVDGQFTPNVQQMPLQTLNCPADPKF